MVLTIILIVILAIVLYLLFVPLQLIIDTDNQLYAIKAKGLFMANVEWDDVEVIKVNIHTIFYRFNVYPLRKSKKKKVKKLKTKAVDKPKKSVPFKTVFNVIRTFEIKRFYLNIDTGNCISNAKLYPVISCLNYYTRSHIDVNFQGRNTLYLTIENRPIRIIKAIINK